LIDRNICEKMSSAVDPLEGVIEIGSGFGTLTIELSKKFKKVLSIEIDSKIFEILKRNLIGFTNVKILNCDALKLDFKKIISEEFNEYKCLAVCANLPYYATTPLIMSLLESDSKIKHIVVMVQKELALRFLAEPGTKDCGAISTSIRFYSIPKILFNVSRNCFFPVPNVDSSVISFDVIKNNKVKDKELFFKIVRFVFSKRRKMILNSLSSSLKIQKCYLLKLLKKLGIHQNSRAENLKFQNFVDISNILTIEKNILSKIRFL